MSLTRRNVAAVGDVKPPASSIWEDEANEYWKEMEPAKRYKRMSKYAACVLLVLAAAGGGFFVMRTVWNQLSVTGLRDQVLPAFKADASASADTADTAGVTADAGKSEAPLPATKETVAPAPAAPEAENPALINNPAAVDLLRARCRVRGVQTRWHEETCRKLCIRYSTGSIRLFLLALYLTF